MKAKTVLFFISALVVSLGLWALLRKKAEPSASPTEPIIQSQTSGSPLPSNFPTPSPSPAHQSTASQVSPEVRQYVEQKRTDPLYDWKRPIYFYGRVLDESNQPVSDAPVHFVWNDLSTNGTSETNTKSDGTGLFSFSGQNGKRLFVTVTKDGYYSSRENPLAFEYANPAEGIFAPDINNPVVFHLRKKGQAEPLIKCEQKIRVAIGTPVSFDMKSCGLNAGASAIQIELLKNRRGSGNTNDWDIKLTVPSGGIQFATNEFLFAAPDTDYLPSLDLNLGSPRPDTWRNNGYAGGVVFVQSSGVYGRIEIRMVPGSSYLRLLSYCNPSGSRNLEVDPNNTAQPAQ